MKRLFILLISLMIAAVACGQEVLKRDLEIRKTAPVLNLNGLGAVLRFNNGDVSLTQSSNLLTLSGGDLSLGANNLSLTGSLGATGSRLAKGWFANLEITNLPTINGGALKTALSLTASDVGLGDVTNESKSDMFDSPSFTGSASAVTAFIPGVAGMTSLGTTTNDFSSLYLRDGGSIWFGYGGGSALSLEHDGIGALILDGSLGSAASRVTKGWFTDLETTNAIAGSITGNAATVTGFTRNGGTLTLSGGHGLTVTTAGITSVTLPTSGTLVANPMTTAGDLIVGGTAGAPTRLAAGITGADDYSAETYNATGTGDVVLNNGATITDPAITNAPRSTGTVVAGTGITAAMLSRFMYFNTASAIDITADPQIANGTSGQIITIIGSSDTNTLTLDDATGLRLTGQMVLGIGDNITLFYEGTIGDWIEISRSNN